MRVAWLAIPVVVLAGIAHARQAGTAPAPAAAATGARPLPEMRALLLDVEQHQRAAEAMRSDYTYHVHLEQVELDGKGQVKKTVVTDSESVTIDGVRIDRVVARDGKPLTPDEAAKESARIDKEVAKDKERRQRLQDKGEATDTRGDQLITASRILELGRFTNPRRVELNGRPTILADYAGDPNAKTRNAGEGIIRDLVGQVWIDEQDHALVRGQGHFLNDFKIGGGLILDIHKGLSFEFRATHINGEVWLPDTVDAQGSARYLLFGSINGRIHLVTSDYRKFRTTATILPGDAGQDDGPPPVGGQPPTPAPLNPAALNPAQLNPAQQGTQPKF